MHCLLFPTVRIGAMLAYTPLDEKSLALLLSYLQDFLKSVPGSPQTSVTETLLTLWVVMARNSLLLFFQVPCEEFCVSVQCEWLRGGPSGVPPQGRLRSTEEMRSCLLIRRWSSHPLKGWDFAKKPFENRLSEVSVDHYGVYKNRSVHDFRLLPGQNHLLSFGKLLRTLFTYLVCSWVPLFSFYTCTVWCLPRSFEKEFHHVFWSQCWLNFLLLAVVIL